MTTQPGRVRDGRPEEAPLLAVTDLAGAVAAVRAEGWDLDLEDVRLHDDGWENLVLETRDGWIIRFPRPHAPSFTRELAVLAAVGPRVAVPTPTVEHNGRRTRAMVYRTLTGAPFDATAWRSADDATRDRFAAGLGRLLAELHDAWTVGEADALGVPRADVGLQVDEVRDRLHLLPADVRGAVERVCADAHRSWVQDPPDEPEVVLHSDLHLGNMVLSAPLGDVVGLWDFSCVQIGRPSLDLRYLTGYAPGLADPAELMDMAGRVVHAYRDVTGRSLDPRRAAAALRVEDLHDAVRSDDVPRVRMLVQSGRG